ncbi:hypothetical protein ACFPT7_18060 [Acidicapsa dinghuensis]|uniref:Uncharacterized protein n=1 Tax=Acidicapsa dinghuensis TaxID=2218256 RepID=A0ABW1EJ47_9BACT|nr:hypothetical protein [Acidicapsa dinghuensis]
MKLRIAVWAVVGAFVVTLWSAYFMAVYPSLHGLTLTLLCLTCPIALIRHYPMSVYVVLLTNAATYAAAGALIETIWRQFKSSHRISN